MDIPITHPGFEGRNLFVRTPGLLSNAGLYIDGPRAEQSKRRYALKEDEGREAEVKLKSSFFDPIPRLQIRKDTIKLADAAEQAKMADWAEANQRST